MLNIVELCTVLDLTLWTCRSSLWTAVEHLCARRTSKGTFNVNRKHMKIEGKQLDTTTSSKCCDLIEVFIHPTTWRISLPMKIELIEPFYLLTSTGNVLKLGILPVVRQDASCSDQSQPDESPQRRPGDIKTTVQFGKNVKTPPVTGLQ